MKSIRNPVLSEYRQARKDFLNFLKILIFIYVGVGYVSISGMASVSVVLPTHNRKQFLEESVESVLQQTYSDLELIVVDGGSDDGTLEYLQSIEDDRVTLVTHDEPRGLSAARNAGLQRSSSKYIVFLDDDDRLLEDAIRTLVETISRQPRDCGGIYTARRIVDPPDNQEERLTTDGTVDRFEDASIFGPSCTLIRRSVVEEIGPFDESFPAREDTDFWIRLFSNFHMVGLDEILYERRNHDEQMSKNKNLMMRGGQKLVAKEYRATADEVLATVYRGVAVAEARFGKTRKARSTLRTAICLDRSDPITWCTYLCLCFGRYGFILGETFYHRVYRPLIESCVTIFSKGLQIRNSRERIRENS